MRVPSALTNLGDAGTVSPFIVLTCCIKSIQVLETAELMRMSKM